jgi:hypothetical protein
VELHFLVASEQGHGWFRCRQFDEQSPVTIHNDQTKQQQQDAISIRK